jgi:hypothetical protein
MSWRLEKIQKDLGDLKKYVSENEPYGVVDAGDLVDPIMKQVENAEKTLKDIENTKGGWKSHCPVREPHKYREFMYRVLLGIHRRHSYQGFFRKDFIKAVEEVEKEDIKTVEESTGRKMTIHEEHRDYAPYEPFFYFTNGLLERAASEQVKKIEASAT